MANWRKGMCSSGKRIVRNGTPVVAVVVGVMGCIWTTVILMCGWSVFMGYRIWRWRQRNRTLVSRIIWEPR